MATKHPAPIENTTTTTEEGGTSCHPGERDFWLSIGLPYCDKCCNPRGTDSSGQTICRINEPDTCPLLGG
jgi:hypothetical protein